MTENKTNTTYRYTKVFKGAFDDVEQRVREALQEEGFGVLTEINVKETLKKKLGVDFYQYKILGACNPYFAHQALQTEQGVGVMLPCNVILYEDREGIAVSAILPTVAMSMINNPKLQFIAQQVEEKLMRVIDSLEVD